MYIGENTAACRGDWKEGCLTKDSLGFSGSFSPQWVAVMPGLNLSVPIFLQYQLYGNAVTRAGGSKRGNKVFTIGLAAQWLAAYNASITYAAFDGQSNGRKTIGPVGVYDAADRGGFGTAAFSDRSRVYLTLSTTF